MRSSLVAVALMTAIASAPVMADDLSLTFGRFQGLTQNTDHSGKLSVMWREALPIYASDCHMTVDTVELNRVFVYNARFDSSYAASFESAAYDAEHDQLGENNYVEYWNALYSANPDKICDIANTWWGEFGIDHPGVLIKEE